MANEVEKLKKQFSGQLYAPYFADYVQPAGFLTKDMACHALFNYYLSARSAYERNEKDTVVLEGELDPVVNYKQLMSSIAKIYGVTPEQMVHYWSNVDIQCDMLHIPRMPMGDRYRFNEAPEINTNIH